MIRSLNTEDEALGVGIGILSVVDGIAKSQ